MNVFGWVLLAIVGLPLLGMCLMLGLGIWVLLSGKGLLGHPGWHGAGPKG